MNVFILASLEMQREGRKPSDLNYGTIWTRRAYKIRDYIIKAKAKNKKG
jgi:hypothetical protein